MIRIAHTMRISTVMTPLKSRRNSFSNGVKYGNCSNRSEIKSTLHITESTQPPNLVNSIQITPAILRLRPTLPIQHTELCPTGKGALLARCSARLFSADWLFSQFGDGGGVVLLEEGACAPFESSDRMVFAPPAR